MSKPCSERAWGPPSSAPFPPIKAIWVSAWLLPLSVHPVLIQAPPPSPGWGPLPARLLSLLLARLACWITGCPGPVVDSHASLPFRGHGERTGGNSSCRLACSPCRQRFLQCPTAPLAARQGPLVLLKGQEPVSARASVGSRAGSMGGPQLQWLQSVEGQLPSLPLINSLYRPNSCISHFYLTEKVALTVQILKNQNAFKKGEE